MSADDAAAGVEARVAAVKSLAAVVLKLFGQQVLHIALHASSPLPHNEAGISSMESTALHTSNGEQHFHVQGTKQSEASISSIPQQQGSPVPRGDAARLLGDIACGAALEAMEDYTTDNRCGMARFQAHFGLWISPDMVPWPRRQWQRRASECISWHSQCTSSMPSATPEASRCLLHRGDVGSWVREAAMAGLAGMLPVFSALAPDSAAVFVARAAAALAKQAVERIGRMRQVTMAMAMSKAACGREAPSKDCNLYVLLHQWMSLKLHALLQFAGGRLPHLHTAGLPAAIARHPAARCARRRAV